MASASRPARDGWLGSALAPLAIADQRLTEASRPWAATPTVYLKELWPPTERKDENRQELLIHRAM